jgi:hypothetical protein
MALIKVESYIPATMALLSADVTGVDFGDVIKGQHGPNVVAIRPVKDGITFDALALFLENANGVDHTQFGKFKSASAIPGITPGSDYLSDYFVQITGISDTSMLSAYSDYGIMYNAASPEYSWMDAEAGVSESVGDSAVNFRFVFEYH